MLAERLARGLKYLEARGYFPKLGQHVRDQHGYLAGKDEDRVADLNAMFRDPEVDAIFCTRGGYGTPRLLDKVDYAAIAADPKLLVGYSDITALQLAILAKTGLATISGPMVAVEFGIGIDPFTEENFWPLVNATEPLVKMTAEDGPLEVLQEGTVTGQIISGNLAMICALLGTDFLPDFAGAILVLEEVGEDPFRIDRMLSQMRLAGLLSQVAGLVLGQFSGCRADEGKDSLTIEQIFAELTGGLSIPILANLPYGHVPVSYSVPLGVLGRLDSKSGSLQLLTPCVRSHS